MKREFSSLQKTNKGLQAKMKKLEDQAKAAIKAQNNAEEKAEAAEAIRKVAESQKREAEERMVQAEKELQEALATKDTEIKEADEKAYTQGMADVTEAYELQMKQAYNKGFTLGWMSLLKKLNVPEDSPLRKADAIPLPFPPAQPSNQDVGESESEDDKEGDGVVKETTPEQASSDIPVADKSIDETLAQIDAEIAEEKAAEVALLEPSEVQTQVAVDADEA
ncbi:uncharacterized protein LOC114319152 [Camellia sinensis]|uniref:uncharacterized protein LOC114319152 n=1 Tax=Camellia sinensis TaxID=4442 RepID=UPI001035D35E|nr:uncharacterized protein LOC114319152 [Camellia sinensis]